MYFKRIYDTDLAQASYLIGCQQQGTAIVIDPMRNTEPYLELAKQENLRIVAVTETHIHADYLSGSRELAHHTGATLYLSDEGGADWQYPFPHTGLRDGQHIKLGNITLTALHTPGHTPEHLSFQVTDAARGQEPVLLLTGDFVFVGDLGRPDLLDEAAGGENTRFLGAQQLFHSLKNTFLTLPDHVQVWPGHGSGSACGKALGAMESTTVGYERKTAWWRDFVQNDDLEGFTRILLSGQPDAPFYYGRMKRQNRAGPDLLGEVAPLPEIPTADLAARMNRSTRFIDPRSLPEFQQGALKGSIHLPDSKTFETWAGWLLDADRSYVLLARDRNHAEQLRRKLWMVGIDQVTGFVSSLNGLNLQPQRPTRAQELGDLSQKYVLDVRAQSEYAAGHIPGARQLHAGRVMWNLQTLPTDQDVIVHCQGGARSAAVVSALRAEGFTNITELAGGYQAYQKLEKSHA